MKRIAFDNSPLSSGHSARGTGVYTKNLSDSLIKRIAIERNYSFDVFDFTKNRDKLPNYDIIHYPYFDLFFHTLSFHKPARTIVTVHDVIPLLYPKYYPPGLKGTANFHLQKLSLSNVSAIMTVSETSKKDIVRYLHIPEKKVFPAYLGPNLTTKKVSSKLLKEIKSKLHLPDEFVLYIGDVNWNKNIINLVSAIKRTTTILVMVGKQAVETNYDKKHIENQPLVTLQEKYGHDHQIIRLGYLNNDDLNAIWQLATLYVMPSLYEGFGLPVLEAMNAKVPVVCSKTQALVEIADDSAYYFDPNDPSDIANKIEDLLKKPKLRAGLIKKGAIKARDYSWDKTADKTFEVYKKVLRDE